MTRHLTMLAVAFALAVSAACGRPSSAVDVQLSTTPNPPQMGTNTFEATVTEQGKPVDDASVSVEFSMAAMPSMNMADMRSSTTLTHDANGKYRGTGQLMTSGNWDTTVTVRRGTATVATQKLTLAAQ